MDGWDLNLISGLPREYVVGTPNRLEAHCLVHHIIGCEPSEPVQVWFAVGLGPAPTGCSQAGHLGRG